MTTTPLLDEQFRRRIESSLSTVQNWDRTIAVNKEIVREIRTSIPWDVLRSTEFNTQYDHIDDDLKDRWYILSTSPTALFLQRFIRYFQNHVMTWINQPPCRICNETSHMKHVTTRGPLTHEEKQGEASRVEVYMCTQCNIETTFPRYNSIAKLQQTKCGRCGEYANLFGFYCAYGLGIHTRYILDMTDHVWTEVLLQDYPYPPVSPPAIPNNTQRTTASPSLPTIRLPYDSYWCMMDSCEGVINEPSMYEKGWGKSLSIIVSLSSDNGVIDITPKYTRQFYNPEFQSRRRSFTSSEQSLHSILNQINHNSTATSGKNETTTITTGNNSNNKKQQQRRTMTTAKRSEQDQLDVILRLQQEQQQQQHQMNSSGNNDNDKFVAPPWDLYQLYHPHSTTTSVSGYQKGRISGAMEWKLARNEAGGTTTTTDVPEQQRHHEDGHHPQQSFMVEEPSYIETYYPCSLPLVDDDSTTNDNDGTSGTNVASTTIQVRPAPQQFYPYHHVTKCQQAIVVNGVPCAMRSTSCHHSMFSYISVVVLDPNCLGCILQSKCLYSEYDLYHFITTLPRKQIVAIVGQLLVQQQEQQSDDSDNNVDNNNNNDTTTTTTPETSLSALLLQKELGGGFCTEYMYNGGILFIGQVGTTQPDWAHCCRYEDAPNGFQIQLPYQKDDSDAAKASSPLSLPPAPAPRRRKMKILPNTHPQSVVGRLPESYMTLATQRDADLQQKLAACRKFVELDHDHQSHLCFGFTTKSGSPIYLLGHTAYPLMYAPTNNNSSSTNEEWTTILLLPEHLVPDTNDEENSTLCRYYLSDDSALSNKLPQYEVPLEESFFVSSLGSHLLTSSNDRLPTVDVLRNSRLVGLYFSAHWCGPCRSFTPMLAEMYETLKSQFPVHGLEIVFVSSDRDDASFLSYYATMPWKAVPFDALNSIRPALSATYNVTGIPSLVILDSISGQIVVPNSETRQLVMEACRRGDDAIQHMFQNTWLGRVPPESQQLLDMLSMSCQDSSSNDKDEALLGAFTSPALTAYLLRAEYVEKQKRLESLTAQLVEEGMELDEAMEAAMACEQASSEEEKTVNDVEIMPNGPWTGVHHSVLTESNNMTPTASRLAAQIAHDTSHQRLMEVLSTASKYLANCSKCPYMVKYRHIQLSFKVADKITSVMGGIPLLESIGFVVYCSSEDYIASIPIYADPDTMQDEIQKLIAEYTTS